jgi:hypothetical protein
MASSKGSDSIKQPRYNLSSGKVPLLSAVDDEVDWTMVAIEMRAFLMRFEGYTEALFESQLVDLNARAEQKRRLGKNNALHVVYSYLVEMCAPNKTAMLQVREHATSDPEFYANNLWKMLEIRFTQERLNKIQGYLNEIGRVKHEANEDFKIFVDRFKKLVGDVRSIDPKQVPTDVNLMGVLKEALSGHEVLWGHLTFAKNISLEEMMDTVSKWKSKSQKAQISDSAVANYSSQPDYLKKSHAKKQRSGRASGLDDFTDREETRACLACKEVGHLVKDCRDRFAKESWLSKREKKKREQDHDNSRDRKHDERQSRERSSSRTHPQHPRHRSRSDSSERSQSTERSHSRDRSDGRENYKKSNSAKSNNNWMSSNGEEFSGSENSEEE